MESPGEYLKREREIRKVPLSKIFECTRVPMKYLEALEADDLARLPHQTFVKGYIKSYCKCLGLDETDAVLRYELFLKEQGAAREEEAAPERQEAKKPMVVFAPHAKDELERESLPFLRSYGNIIALAAAGVAAVAIIYVAAARRHSAPPAAVTQTETPVTAAAPEGSVQQVAPPSPAALPVTAAPVEPVRAPETPVGQAAAKAAAPTQAAPAAPAQMTKTVTPVPAKAAATAEKKEAPAPTGHLLVARASETTWIKLTIDNGEPFDVVLRAGEKIAWKAEKGYDIVVGNAAGVALSLDGKEVAGLGKAGEVVKLTLPAGTPALNAKGAVKPPVKPARATADTVAPAGAISGSTAARPAPKKASPKTEKPETQAPAGPPADESADAVKPRATEAPRWESAPKNRFEVRPADDIQ